MPPASQMKFAITMPTILHNQAPPPQKKRCPKGILAFYSSHSAVTGECLGVITIHLFDDTAPTHSFNIFKILQLSTEKAMATHSSTLAWKIPWMDEPGRLQSMGSLKVGHDWATSLSLFTFMHWRRKWQPTPVFLPGESQGRGSLVCCCLWGRTESDTTEVT